MPHRAYAIVSAAFHTSLRIKYTLPVKERREKQGRPGFTLKPHASPDDAIFRRKDNFSHSAPDSLFRLKEDVAVETLY